MENSISQSSTEYLSYLLRVWRTGSGAMDGWHASLENPHTGERFGFASLEELFAFVMQQTEQAGHNGGESEQ